MARELDTLIAYFAKLPGLGPRSAKRVVLHLLKSREKLLTPLADAMHAAALAVKTCSVCGNFDAADPCGICTDQRRDRSTICVVEDVADVWAMERAQLFKGVYHVLGGTLSAIDGRTPDMLNVNGLAGRVQQGGVHEVILATNATVEGQTTAHYIQQMLQSTGVKTSRLAQGVPMGGELDFLDEGTLGAALHARLPF